MGRDFLLRADALSPSSKYSLASFQPQARARGGGMQFWCASCRGICRA